MTPELFAELAAQDYNRLPVSREVLADTDTPLSAYLKLAQQPWSFLLESVQGGEKWGRYSIIGLPCRRRLEVRGYQVQIIDTGAVIESRDVQDPLAFVEDYATQFRVPTLDNLPVFHGGLVGYFGYDCVRYVEPRLRDSTPEDELGVPDILLMVADEILVFDNLAGTLQLVVNANCNQESAWEKAQSRLDELVQALAKPAPRPGNITLPASDSPVVVADGSFGSHFTEQDYFAAVDSIKEYVLAGDAMQVVPSQRLSMPFSKAPIDLYRALRNLNPSPYMYYLNLEHFHIVGSSPEILARLEQGTVTVRPIAGTRRRGRSEAEDRAMEEELLADPKEIAEHLMLIDLGRNDVGRIAETGSVELTDKMVVERYSHVMHIVSNVTGTLSPEHSAIDVLRATLPAGTLSGAPKIRAMEIIDELEPVKRGVYGGAVGYLSWQGDMDTAIAIRTAVIKDDVLYVQAGGGVVADSVPRLEYKETLNKASAILRAAAMVQASGEEV
ncbi:MAG: anthranilate synthase component I [Pseudomonadota bacterium]